MGQSEVQRLMDMASEQPPEMVKAATLVQSAARGHLARTEVQEASRLEWLKYYIDSGLYDKALELCVTDEEVEKVRQLQAAASTENGPVDDSTDDSVQEHRRVTWLNYYIDEGKYEQALELCVTPEEEARVTEKQKDGAPVDGTPVDDATEEHRRITWL